MRNKFVLKLSLASAAGLFLSLAPILDPYVILELGSIDISVNNIYGLILMIISASKKYSLKHNSFLIKLCTIFLFATIFASAVTSGLGFTYTFRPLIFWFAFSIMVSYIWQIPCKTEFYKYAIWFSYFASIIIILQFICGNSAIPMWDGRIPFFQLSSSDQWSGYIDYNAHTIRPCGIFQEASYAGIYLLVTYAYAMKEKKYRSAVLFLIAMCLTASLFAVLGCIVITLYLVLGDKSVEKKVKSRIVVLSVLISIAIVWLTQRNSGVSSVVQYILHRMTNFGNDLHGVRMSSTKMRLIGYLDLFERFDFGQKLFGVGNFAVVFSTPNTYTSVLVYILLNYGIIGFLSFILLFITSIFKNSGKDKNLVFYFIILIVFAMDFQWFSWYFFYILTPCFVAEKR